MKYSEEVRIMARFKVKELAKKQGLTSEDLARKSGLKISTVRNLYQDAVENPGVHTLAAVAKALGVRIEDLLGDDGGKPDLDNSNRSGVKSKSIQTPSLAAEPVLG